MGVNKSDSRRDLRDLGRRAADKPEQPTLTHGSRDRRDIKLPSGLTTITSPTPDGPPDRIHRRGLAIDHGALC